MDNKQKELLERARQYRDGSEGSEKNLKKAEELYHVLAEEGVVEAQDEMALLYYDLFQDGNVIENSILKWNEIMLKYIRKGSIDLWYESAEIIKLAMSEEERAEIAEDYFQAVKECVNLKKEAKAVLLMGVSLCGSRTNSSLVYIFPTLLNKLDREMGFKLIDMAITIAERKKEHPFKSRQWSLIQDSYWINTRRGDHYNPEIHNECYFMEEENFFEALEKGIKYAEKELECAKQEHVELSNNPKCTEELRESSEQKLLILENGVFYQKEYLENVKSAVESIRMLMQGRGEVNEILTGGKLDMNEDKYFDIEDEIREIRRQKKNKAERIQNLMEKRETARRNVGHFGDAQRASIFQDGKSSSAYYISEFEKSQRGAMREFADSDKEINTLIKELKELNEQDERMLAISRIQVKKRESVERVDSYKELFKRFEVVHSEGELYEVKNKLQSLQYYTVGSREEEYSKEKAKPILLEAHKKAVTLKIERLKQEKSSCTTAEAFRKKEQEFKDVILELEKIGG